MALPPSHILFESATGCAIFKCVQVEEIGNKTRAVQESIQNLNSFGKMVQLLSFSPFKSAVDALQSCLDISEGEPLPEFRACVAQADVSHVTIRRLE